MFYFSMPLKLALLRHASLDIALGLDHMGWLAVDEFGVDLGRTAGQPLVAVLVDNQQDEEDGKQADADADVVDRGLGTLIPVQEWVDPRDTHVHKGHDWRRSFSVVSRQSYVIQNKKKPTKNCLTHPPHPIANKQIKKKKKLLTRYPESCAPQMSRTYRTASRPPRTASGWVAGNVC